jgi:hypothetical protein
MDNDSPSWVAGPVLPVWYWGTDLTSCQADGRAAGNAPDCTLRVAQPQLTQAVRPPSVYSRPTVNWRLEELFSDDYLEYKHPVRRWIGRS